MGILSGPMGMCPSYDISFMRPCWMESWIELVFGASSIASSQADHPDITITRTGVGVYNLTYPPTLNSKIVVDEIFSAARTVSGVLVTAKSATAGTATISVINNAGSLTDPATNDTMLLSIFMKTEATGT